MHEAAPEREKKFRKGRRLPSAIGSDFFPISKRTVSFSAIVFRAGGRLWTEVLRLCQILCDGIQFCFATVVELKQFVAVVIDHGMGVGIFFGVSM